jgi:Transposase DDE domain
MPFKHNASRRNHIPKARRRITNWPAYEAGLRRRGDVTFWLHETALSGWRAPRRTSRGGQPIYADIAIEVVLTMLLVFPLALRQAEGFIRSVLRLLGLQIAVPDHSTLSRRGRGFAGRQPRAVRHDRPVHVVLDSTGLQIFGQGEWDAEKHGRKPRQWGAGARIGRKLAESLLERSPISLDHSRLMRTC